MHACMPVILYRQAEAAEDPFLLPFYCHSSGKYLHIHRNYSSPSKSGDSQNKVKRQALLIWGHDGKNNTYIPHRSSSAVAMHQHNDERLVPP